MHVRGMTIHKQSYWIIVIAKKRKHDSSRINCYECRCIKETLPFLVVEFENPYKRDQVSSVKNFIHPLYTYIETFREYLRVELKLLEGSLAGIYSLKKCLTLGDW